MDIMYSCSVNSYIKNMDMQVKWQNKKKDGDYSADGKKTVAQWAEEQREKTRERSESANGTDSGEYDKSKDKVLKSITDKLNRGDRLTYSEKQYLQKRDPQAYQAVIDTEKEQLWYETQMKRCRTKDEFHKLRMIRTASSLSTVSSVRNNPNVSRERKLEIIAGEQRKNAALEKTEKEFIKQGGLSRLPTQAECIAAAKKLAEARRAEKKQKDETVKKTVKKPQPVKDKDGKNSNTQKTETKTVTVKKKKYTLKRKITRAEAEQSYVVKKVKKAMKRGGIAVTGTALSSADAVVKTLNVKA